MPEGNKREFIERLWDTYSPSDDKGLSIFAEKTKTSLIYITEQLEEVSAAVRSNTKIVGVIQNYWTFSRILFLFAGSTLGAGAALAGIITLFCMINGTF